jgi:hypothetical protein
MKLLPVHSSTAKLSNMVIVLILPQCSHVHKHLKFIKENTSDRCAPNCNKLHFFIVTPHNRH